MDHLKLINLVVGNFIALKNDLRHGKFSHYSNNIEIFAFQDDGAVLSSKNWATMKSSLNCLILGEDLELLAIEDIFKNFLRLTPISEPHVNLIVRRGISMALHIGGVREVQRFWRDLQSRQIISDPSKLTKAVNEVAITFTRSMW